MTAEVSTNCVHAPWCDPDRHDDGNLGHPVPDPDWQICFSTLHTLEFGERGAAGANVAEICADLNLVHTDVWGEPGDVMAWLTLDGTDGFNLTPDQLVPFANLLLSLDALFRGDRMVAEEFLTKAQTGVVEIEVDTEREKRREAARCAWRQDAAR